MTELVTETQQNHMTVERDGLMNAVKLYENDEMVKKATEFIHEQHEKIMAALRPATSLAPTAPLSHITAHAHLDIFKRIYVGSISFDIVEQDLWNVFGQFGTIVTVSLMMDPVTKKHRGYCFMEFETAEAASLAFSTMDGAPFGGRRLKVGRPNNFPNELPVGVPRPLPNRLYIANIHEMVQEEELKGILEAFGPVKFCNLVPEPDGRKHKGYAYLEFERVQSAVMAVKSMNGFELAGRPLRVCKTVIGGQVPSGMSSLPEGRKKTTSTLRSNVPEAVMNAARMINKSFAVSGPAPTPTPTACLLLKNMVDYSEIADPSERAELETDVKDELSKYGTVKLVKVKGTPEDQLVMIYIAFEKSDDMHKAFSVMNGRWFSGRQITAEICTSMPN